MPDDLPTSIFGYQVRSPFDGERDYFRKNPGTAGMMTKDRRVTLNPYDGLGNKQKRAVLVNEAARLYMKDQGIVPGFELTPGQIESFKGSPYEGNPVAMKETVVGRIISGDASAGDVTGDQKAFADSIFRYLKMRGK